MKRFAILFVLLAMISAIWLPTLQAQEDPEAPSPEEQQALFDRALAAFTTFYTEPQTYAVNAYSEDHSIFVFNFSPDNTTTEETLKTYETFYQVDRTASTLSGTFSLVVEDVSAENAYSVSGEFRYVDGLLYINAAYGEDSGEVPVDLADGWAVIDDVENHPVFDNLNLKEPIKYLDATNRQDEITDMAVLGDNYIQVTTTPEEMPDGTSVDVIMISLDKQGFIAAVIADEDGTPVSEAELALFENLPDTGEVAQIMIAVDAEGQMRGMATFVTFTIEGVDLSILSDDVSEGATFDLLGSTTDVNEYTDFDAEFEAVEAPVVE